MKTKSIYLAALLSMTVLATYASDEPKKADVAVIPMKGAEVFKLIYKSETANRVKVTLYNPNDEVIYSGGFSNTLGFILPLNFSQLAFGEYKLQVVDVSGKRTEKIVYQPAKAIDNIRVAKIADEEAKFIVSVANAQNKKVTVRIFDNYNNLLHNEVKKVDGNFAQVYTVKNMTGTCTFEVSDAAGVVKTVRF